MNARQFSLSADVIRRSDDGQCKHKRAKGFTLHRCSRPSVRDGYCTRHHPSYLSPKDQAALQAWEKRDE